MWFLNPWITGGNSKAIVTSSGALTTGTTFYIYVVIVNTGTTAYNPTAGTIDLTWFGSNHIDGYLLGIYYSGKFFTTSPTINPGNSYYAIFKIAVFTIGNVPWTVQPGSPSAMFWGLGHSRMRRGAIAETRASLPAQSFFPDYGY